MLIFNMIKDDQDEETPDISHIPNDHPIPSRNPDKAPANIPANEPSGPTIPGPVEAPIREPNKNPKIHVLNIEL